MERRWYATREKNLEEKRVLGNIKNDMDKWACSRARVEEEITRRQEGSINGNRFENRAYI